MTRSSRPGLGSLIIRLFVVIVGVDADGPILSGKVATAKQDATVFLNWDVAA